MYESHWSLNARPFENFYQREFYYPSESHQAALLKLRYCIENRRSAAVLCGASGMGKSLLTSCLLEQMPESVAKVIVVKYPMLDAAGMMRYIARKLTGPDRIDSQLPLESTIQAIEDCIAETTESNQHTVIIFDEAHLLEQNHLLEPLRLLMNLGNQDHCESALHLVFCGQPVFLSQIDRHVAFDERIGTRCLLERFNADETAAYIGHRLRAAGGRLDSVFTPESLEQIYHCSEGIPRRINRLCDLALTIGYAQEIQTVTPDIIGDVHRELTAPSNVE